MKLVTLPKRTKRGSKAHPVAVIREIMAAGRQSNGMLDSPSASISGRIPHGAYPEAATELSPVVSRHFNEGTPLSVFSSEHSLYANKLHDDSMELVQPGVSAQDLAKQVMQSIKAASLQLYRRVACLDLRDVGRAATLVLGAVTTLICLMVAVWMWQWFTGPACPEPRLLSFLQTYRLRQYEGQLCTQGYELLEDLCRASESELEAAGISLKPHRLRIIENAGVYASRWSWIGTAVFSAFLLALLSAVTVAAVLLFFPAVRVRVQTAAAVAVLIVWQKVMELFRFWQSIEVPDEAGGKALNGESSPSTVAGQREEYLPLSSRTPRSPPSPPTTGSGRRSRPQSQHGLVIPLARMAEIVEPSGW
mmetsp:Transcript_13928/g.39435  ORF Transcript_13928/g.39435 Transcript_13928/m.39435 type:complete len:363 (-) Transcript_13928:130-1218(-)